MILRVDVIDVLTGSICSRLGTLTDSSSYCTALGGDALCGSQACELS